MRGHAQACPVHMPGGWRWDGSAGPTVGHRRSCWSKRQAKPGLLRSREAWRQVDEGGRMTSPPCSLCGVRRPRPPSSARSRRTSTLSRSPAPVRPGTCAGRKRSFSRLLSSSTARRSCRMRHCSSLRPLRAQDDSSPCLPPLTLVGRQWKNSAQVLTDSCQVGVRLCRYTVPHD